MLIHIWSNNGNGNNTQRVRIWEIYIWPSSTSFGSLIYLPLLPLMLFSNPFPSPTNSFSPTDAILIWLEKSIQIWDVVIVMYVCVCVRVCVCVCESLFALDLRVFWLLGLTLAIADIGFVHKRVIAHPHNDYSNVRWPLSILFLCCCQQTTIGICDAFRHYRFCN